MLDTTASVSKSSDDWQQTISAGDIVLYRFPIAGAGNEAPAARPCLVVEIQQRCEMRFALLAPGSPITYGHHRPLDLRVAAEPDTRSAGLRQPTVFSGDVRVLVSLANKGFAAAPASGGPVIGRLDGAALSRFSTLLEQIGRGPKHGKRRQWFRRVRPADRIVVVESRCP